MCAGAEADMSDAVWEEARETPVAADCDVCVIGGSCTGVFAAVAAARLGAKVAIVERNGFFGGAATAGLVNHWHSLYDVSGERQIIAGLTEEVVERLRRRRGVSVNEAAKPAPGGYLVLNTEQLKLELDSLVLEAKVRPFLRALCVAALEEEGGIGAAVIEDKTGRRAIRARCFIDASGDGDLIARAALPFRTRDDLQPPTMCAWFW
jgi:flavin-dependent dehydrogenase